MKNSIIITILIYLSLSFSYGQNSMTPDSSLIEAMDNINFLSGQWSGEGWIQMGRDKSFFTQHEIVEQKVNNTVMVIEGKGIDTESGNIIHQAFAVISYDVLNKKYLMRAFKADGKYIDAEASFNSNGAFVWGFTIPHVGEIRYTIKLVNNEWIELGEMNREGNNWFPFFEMKLSKK